MHLMPILKKVVLPSVKECMKNGGKIGMASIESSASIVVHVVIRVKSIPSSVGGLGRLGLIGVTLYHMPHKSGATHYNASSSSSSSLLLLYYTVKSQFWRFFSQSILSRSNVSSWLCYPHRFSRSGEIDFLQGFHVKMFRNIRKKPCQNLLLSTSWILIK